MTTQVQRTQQPRVRPLTAPKPGGEVTEAGRTRALASVVIAAAVLSSSYTLTKIALRDVPPLTIGLIRFSLAAGLLAVWVHGVRRYPHPAARDLRRLAVGGLLGITLYFAVENIGVQMATATDAALLVAAYPALTALLELIIYRTRASRAGLLGIALAIVGVYFVVGYAPGGGGPHRRIGDVLLIVSGFVWALYNFATRSVSDRHPAPVVLYYQALAGAAGFLPLALIEHRQWHVPAHPAATIGCLVALTLLCSIAGLGLYAKGLQRLRASTAVNLLNLVPVFGLLIAIIALGEGVTALQLAGGVVVVAGVMITARRDDASHHHVKGISTAMTEPKRENKVAIILDVGLPSGLAANTAAVLALSLGRQLDSIIGPELKDADGSAHAGITTVPIPILTAPTETVKEIRHRAVIDVDGGLVLVDFTDCAQRTRNYDDYARLLEVAADADIAYLGLAVHGPRKLVQRLTGSLPLLK